MPVKIKPGDFLEIKLTETHYVGWSSENGQRAKVGAETGRFQIGEASGSRAPSAAGRD
jgi:hypothetical protein